MWQFIVLTNNFIYKKIKKIKEGTRRYYPKKKSREKEKKRKEKKRKESNEKKKMEKKAATMQRLRKPKHCSYSANWTNQIGTVATVQNLKKKRKKEKRIRIKAAQ